MEHLGLRVSELHHISNLVFPHAVAEELRMGISVVEDPDWGILPVGVEV